MLNLKPFSVPSRGSQGLLRSNTVHNITSPIYGQNRNKVFSLDENRQLKNKQTLVNKQSASHISRPIRIVNCNNMYQEVNWFRQQSLYQAIIKFVMASMLSLILLFALQNSFYLFLSVSAFAFFLMGIQLNIFRKYLKIWVYPIFAISIITLTNEILAKIMSLISFQISQLLVTRSFSLIPSLLVAITFAVIYIQRQLMTVNYPRNFRQAIAYYFSSIKQFLYQINRSKIIILQVYSLSFLLMYVVIAGLHFSYIIFNAQNYIALIHPKVFVAQLITFFIVCFIYHFIRFWIQSPLFWLLTRRFYSVVNRFTGIHTIVQLLNVNPTQQIKKQLFKEGLLNYFNIFALPQSKRSNDLTVKQSIHIYQRALCWIIQYILLTAGDIKKNFYIYSNPSNSQISEPKKQINYFEIISQFGKLHIEKTLQLMNQLLFKVRNLESEKNKYFYQDLFYNFRVWKARYLINLLVLKCGQYLRICQLLLQIIAIAQIRHENQSGKSIQMFKRIKQLNIKSQSIIQLQQVNEIIINRIQVIFKKSNRILRKVLR